MHKHRAYFAVLFHLIVEASGYRRLAKDIKRNSPLTNFQLTRPITVSTHYKAPLQSSSEAVVVSYLDAAAQFGAQSVIQYLQQVQIVHAMLSHTMAFLRQSSSLGMAQVEAVQCAVSSYRQARKGIDHRTVLLANCVLRFYMSTKIWFDSSAKSCVKTSPAFSELKKSLAVAREYKLDRLEEFLAAFYNWHSANSPGAIYNLRRTGAILKVPRPW